MKKFLVLTVAVLATMISFNLLAECTGLSFDPAMDFQNAYDDNGNVVGIYPSNIIVEVSGFTSEDQGGILSFEFYAATQGADDVVVGTYDLGSGNNTNYSTCNQCVRMYRFVYSAEDEDWVQEKQFFQQEGKLQVKHTDILKDDHYYYNGVVSVKLAEATVAGKDENFQSTFVPNGECYEIESAAWTTYPEGSEPADDADTGDTGSSDPADTDPADTGDDTGSEPTEPGDDTTPGETDDTGSNPSDNNEDTDGTSENEDGDNKDGNTNNQGNYQVQPREEDDGGCSLVTI